MRVPGMMFVSGKGWYPPQIYTLPSIWFVRMPSGNPQRLLKNATKNDKNTDVTTKTNSLWWFMSLRMVSTCINIPGLDNLEKLRTSQTQPVSTHPVTFDLLQIFWTSRLCDRPFKVALRRKASPNLGIPEILVGCHWDDNFFPYYLFFPRIFPETNPMKMGIIIPRWMEKVNT